MFLRDCLAHGESLTAPRIHISTIHAVKGKEADHVVLWTALTKRLADQLRIAPDAEHRVFYVGVTRARQTVAVVVPRTQYWYPV